MQMITLHLTGPDFPEPDEAAVTELIQSHAEPADRVEHLRVQGRPGRLDLALFLLADDRSAAEHTARALCLRALRSAPWLADWRLPREAGPGDAWFVQPGGAHP
ncbi:hypothetical protein ACFW1A_17370 [Kitasatospora sp. NPDC058965]|uniref:hypothetical protein n=1 Tax=Kitasatospora sp. NPDC058965 TaxID=3346682 RepID=UPI0036AAB61E